MGVVLTRWLLRRLAPMVALAAVVAVVPAGAAEAPAAPRYRLSLTAAMPAPASGGGREFVARLETSPDGGRTWAGAGGKAVVFAFVGEGAVISISDRAGGMACVTGPAGTCMVTVDSPGDSSLTAVFGDASATAPV
jgi:hypothetical protein